MPIKTKPPVQQQWKIDWARLCLSPLVFKLPKQHLYCLWKKGHVFLECLRLRNLFFNPQYNNSYCNYGGADQGFCLCRVSFAPTFKNPLFGGKKKKICIECIGIVLNSRNTLVCALS